MTFSIVATDETDVGVAVASKFIAVGAIVPQAKAGIGAVATQCYANPRLGSLILKLLESGLNANDALIKALGEDSGREERQLGVVSIRGDAAAYTGSKCPEYAGHIVGSGYAVQGNILAGPEVLERMARAFEAKRGELVDKLLEALSAGDAAGGDRRGGKQSAAIIVLRPGGGYLGLTDTYVDLRVDDHPDPPVSELRRLFSIWELTLLSREDPNDVVLKSNVALTVQRILKGLGLYSGDVNGNWDEATEEAFRAWAGLENFENKVRNDDKIWGGSVYRYLINEARRRGIID
ncbi:DUF1028 domain-containing protein [Vulcanisaeta distributa]|uniref:DUF1028 domain-containing protein n=1 Tax=Vulcanisaeta distributa TaxID=164451 RepID=UPI0006D000CB|nr:DUF1028 domain-containing protein [Vulcanisaeta distributa]